MNTKTMKAIALTGALAIAGCVSVDATRTQLASSNPLEVQKAEENVFNISTRGTVDNFGFTQFTKKEQVEYVNLVSNNALLIRIIEKAGSDGDEVILAAAARIDISKPGVSMEILKNHRGVLTAVSRAEDNQRIKREEKSRVSFKSDVSECFADKIIGSLTNEAELREAFEISELRNAYREAIAHRLIMSTQDIKLLMSLYDGDLRGRINNQDRKNVVLRMADLADKLTDLNDAKKILKASENGWHPYVTDYNLRAKLLSRLPEDEAMAFALESINKQSVNSWGQDDLWYIYDGVAVANSVKNQKSIIKIVSAVLSTVEKIKQSCGSSMLVWDAKEENKAKSIIKRLPILDDAVMEQLICTDTESWRSFINAVSPKIAYNVLLSGKAKSSEVELAMIKKLPKEKVDAAIYAGARFAKTRKAIYNSMTAEMKKSTDAAREKAYKAIVEKAKAAEKETFALEGFYLGMTFDDMLVVFDYHFPNIEINEAFDGDKAEADYVIYVEGQSSPFCYATRKDKKVYQFNFGKKLLKKWYQYDVQTPMEWAHAYARDNKIDMEFKLIDKDTTVYEMDMSRSYHVWFHQESYQYKHNAKEYRLTYFGEEKDFTFEGGIGGAVIKGLAAPKFRYVRGDQGSLRARIEKD